MNPTEDEVAQPQTLGAKIDAYYEQRERKRELTTELKAVNEALAATELEIIAALDSNGAQFAGGHVARATVAESIVPVIEDFDALAAYIRDNDALYLLERRVSIAPWREILESGEAVPGTTSFTKRGLSVRKI